MHKVLILSMALVALMFVGCVNDDYDLTDIDTTAQFNVEDFVIPVNVEEIRLKTVIDLKETSKVKEVTFGDETFYALIEDGEFQSSSINVPGFRTKSPQIAPIKDELTLEMFGLGIKARDGWGDPSLKVAAYRLSNLTTDFHVSATNVDKAIKDFRYAKVDAEFGISLDVSDLSRYLNNVHFENLRLQLIKGLDIERIVIQGETVDEELYDYDESTGLLDLSMLDLTYQTGHFTFNVVIDGLDADLAGIDFNAQAHTLDFDGTCMVKDGEVAIYLGDIKALGWTKERGAKAGSPLSDLLPDGVSFSASFNLSDIKIEEFTGDFEYDIENINIAPVQLNDLPDFLSQKGTNVRLKNPQIYLSVHNPLAGEYGIEAQAGITLTSVNGKEKKSYAADEMLDLDMEDETFLLAPTSSKAYYDYSEFVPYTKLTDLLTGDGLPQSINIDVVDPKAPLQTVYGFRLDESIAPVKGTYKVLVPFELAEGSTVLYNDTINGWSDEDLDNLTITRLGLDMTVTTDIALDMNLKVYPMVIDKNGKSVRKGDMVGTAKVNASAKGQKVTVDMKGEIKRLDGVIFEASLYGVKDSKVLEPNSSFVLKNIKAKVSGHYDKEL